jgi:protein gp37
MGDLFHESVPVDYAADVFDVMAHCKQHTFLLLTKRASQALTTMDTLLNWDHAITTWTGICPMQMFDAPQPLPNVWPGVSVENQAAADERIPWLLQTPAAVRFVSVEPMLSAIDLTSYLPCPHCDGNGTINYGYMRGYDCGCEGRNAIDWTICGGESGPGARPMHPDWARSLRDQCQAAEVPFFFKQWGAWLHSTQLESATTNLGSNPPTYNWPDASTSYLVGKKTAGHLLDGRTWQEFPRRE